MCKNVLGRVVLLLFEMSILKTFGKQKTNDGDQGFNVKSLNVKTYDRNQGFHVKVEYGGV